MTRSDLAAAAAMADPLGAPLENAPGVEASAEAVVGILRANKVPLLDLDGAPGAVRKLTESAVWLEALRRERAERDELASELGMVSGGLLERGITPVLIKSAGGVPYRSSNVDLLVNPACMAEAARVLAGLGHHRIGHYREDRKLLFRRFRGGRSVICTHLHEAVSWGKILILSGDGVVERCRAPRDGAVAAGCRLAAPEDLLVTTLAHSLYETDEVRLSDLRAVRLCAAGPAVDWDRVLQRVERHGWTTGFFAILRIVAAVEGSLWGASAIPGSILARAREGLRTANWARRGVERIETSVTRGLPGGLPHRIPRRFSKLHYLVRLMRSPERSGDERLADLIATAWMLLANRLRLRCRPAALLAVSGLDGSGKSSVIEAVRQALGLCEVPVRVVWSRGGFTVWMAAVKSAARSALPRSIPGPGDAAAKREWLGRPAAGAFFAAAVVVEQALHYFFLVRIRRLVGWSVVCDRFVYDTQADLEAKLGPGGRLARAAGAVMAVLAPRPDLAILLRLSVEEAARRKPADAAAGVFVASRAEAFDRIAAERGLVVVEAERALDEVTAEVVDLSLRAVLARFGGEGR